MGPDNAKLDVVLKNLTAACPSIMMGTDKLIVAACTAHSGFEPDSALVRTAVPKIILIDPATNEELASTTLVKPDNPLAGGTYSYLDEANRLVLIDGAGILTRISHSKNSKGEWQFTTQKIANIGLGSVGIVPDYAGNIWFSTLPDSKNLTYVGYVEGSSNRVIKYKLPAGEGVYNSISSAQAGVAIASTHNLYVFAADNGTVKTVWKQPYDRGSGRKAGQLSYGTGATPTFFGPSTGSEYVTITDNAFPRENLLVYKSGTGEQICKVTIFQYLALSGTEDSSIAVGNNIWVTNTYGYEYPKQSLQDGTKDDPRSDTFSGGMERYEVNAEGTACNLVARGDIKSAGLPRLSTSASKIYTVEADSGKNARFLVIDAANLQVTNVKDLGADFKLRWDPLQMGGPIVDKWVYQGTKGGYIRVGAAG